jgi:hypothetical protein
MKTIINEIIQDKWVDKHNGHINSSPNQPQ